MRSLRADPALSNARKANVYEEGEKEEEEEEEEDEEERHKNPIATGRPRTRAKPELQQEGNRQRGNTHTRMTATWQSTANNHPPTTKPRKLNQAHLHKTPQHKQHTQTRTHTRSPQN